MEEADVSFFAVLTHWVEAIRQWLPPHLFITFQHQLDVDVTAMCFQPCHLFRLARHLLHDGYQVVTDDVVAPWGECEEIRCADMVERALEQRVQRDIAFGLR